MAVFGGTATGSAAGTAAFMGHPIAATVGVALPILAAMGTRKCSRSLTNPRMLRLATRAIDPNLSVSARTAAIARLSRLTGVDILRQGTNAISKMGEKQRSEFFDNQQGAAEEVEAQGGPQ